ncbi:MAG: electron transfer flavoprotein subunit beta/FixA family protein [Thermoleophilia bacterium]|nr:electron transfer flavoprotein subunit beta/FixA family protein [Thermoleophilia bacterium]
MKIAVCVKEVPDTTAEKRFDPSTFRLVRDEGDRMLNEFDKYAIEEALRLKEAGTGDEVILVSVGPEKAVESLRQGLAMGADRLVLVSDPAVAGSDYLGTARALAKAIEEIGAELVLLGSESTDARSGVLAATLGEISGRTWITSANSLTVNGSTITVERQSDDGVDTVEAPLPAVVSVTKAINEPRYPSLKGIMGAKKKPQDVKTLGDIGVAASDVGTAGAKTRVVGVTTPPARTAGQVVKDDGTGAQQILDFLIAKKIV